MVKRFNTYRRELECSTEPGAEFGLPDKVTVVLASDFERLEAELADWKLRDEGNEAERIHDQARIAALEKALEWLETYMFSKHWDGCIERPSVWRMAGPYRHELQKLHGATLFDAVSAALAAPK